MSQFENCEIRFTPLQTAGFVFGDNIGRWEVHKTTSSGTTIIYESKGINVGIGVSIRDESSWNILKRNPFRNEFNEEYNRMIAQLANDGWEIVSTNKYGFVKLLKRPVSGASIPVKPTNSIDLLQQMTNLRDAGILSEQEYQAKKAEILKRI